MKQPQLDKLLSLVSRTGDKVVVIDKASDLMMVLMNLADYESLLNDTHPIKGLSEEEMMNKINRDIALWRSHNQNQDLDLDDLQIVDYDQPSEEPLYFEHDSVDEPAASVTEKPSDFGGIETEESLVDVLTEDEELDFKPEPILEPI